MTTQEQLEAKNNQLSGVENELADLKRNDAPTSDLENEERQALARMAREQALQRVKAALTGEIGQLQQKIAEDETRRARVRVLAINGELGDRYSETLDALEEILAKCDTFALRKEYDSLGRWRKITEWNPRNFVAIEQLHGIVLDALMLGGRYVSTSAGILPKGKR